MTAERLRALLEYDPATGLFRWRRKSGARMNAPRLRGRSKRAPSWFKGNKSVRQYRRLYIKGRHYLAHVVAWALMTGEWPDREIDHRDHNQANNVWTNLRLATHAQNTYNRSVAKNSKTGISGVTHFGARFRAQISFKGAKIHIGVFPTLAAAAEARAKKAQELYEDYAP